MKINRNMSAVITNNQLLRTEKKVSTSMERLSSGFKINHASDNPAGIAISNKMKAQIDALNRAESNAADATSLLQIADGALNEVTSILQRMRELSVQAANGTYSHEELVSIQDEMTELKKEVDRISGDTEYNTKTLLDGSLDVRVYADSTQSMYVSDTVLTGQYRINIEQMATQASVTLPYPTDMKEGTMAINGMSFSLSEDMSQEEYIEVIRTTANNAGCLIEEVEISEGVKGIKIFTEHYGDNQEMEITMSEEMANIFGVDLSEETVSVEEGICTVKAVGKNSVVSLPSDLESSGFTKTTTLTTSGNRIKITDSNGFDIDFQLYNYYVPESANAVSGNYEIDVTAIGSMKVQIGANEYQTMEVRICEISSKSLYIDTIDVSKKNGGENSIEPLDEAIAKVSATRSRIGAFQNRLDYASTGLAETQENMTSAYSGLMDTDMAEEMAEYTQLTVLTQASISVLAQANELPQQILSLLQ